MAPGSISYHICFKSTFICIFYFLHPYYKIQKIYLSYLIISIRSHFRKWPWRDWQPLYCVGCEFFVCFCRCVGLLRSLLLDWYLGSQKLREILMLLCCIILSSSRKTNASSRRSTRRSKSYARKGLGPMHTCMLRGRPVSRPSNLHYKGSCVTRSNLAHRSVADVKKASADTTTSSAHNCSRVVG